MNLLAGIVIPLLTGVVGYLVGIAKDRSNTIHAKKIEAMTKLHERVLEIEQIELSGPEGLITLAVPIWSKRKQRTDSLTSEEVTHLDRQSQWRNELYEEERRARLWLTRKTVDLVSSYFILMMHCKNWDESGQGKSLITDKTFLDCLSCIFGDAEVILENEKVVIWHSSLPLARLLNCNYLSGMCLEVIQKRMNLEVALFPRLQAYCQKWLPFNF